MVGDQTGCLFLVWDTYVLYFIDAIGPLHCVLRFMGEMLNVDRNKNKTLEELLFIKVLSVYHFCNTILKLTTNVMN